MRLGIDEWCFHASFIRGKLDILDFPAIASGFGAEGICLDYFMLPAAVRKNPTRLKDRLTENHIELIFGFSVPFALPASALRLSTGMKRHMFELAHFFGSRILRIIGAVIIPLPGRGRPLHLVINRSAQVNHVIRNLRSFAADARTEGIILALENHADFKIGEMEQILEGVAADNLKVTLDTGNPVMHFEDPLQAVSRLAPHAVYTHIKNMKGRGWSSKATRLDEGEINVRQVLQLLRDSGYQGLYALELDYNFWQWDQEEPAVRASLQYMRSLGQELNI